MIQSISFENYRSFVNQTTLELRPVTILVGPNSSGKSSILKLLGLFAQSWMHGRFESFFKTDGPQVSFRSLKSLRGKPDLPLTLAVEMDPFEEVDYGSSQEIESRGGKVTLRLTANNVFERLSLSGSVYEDDLYGFGDVDDFLSGKTTATPLEPVLVCDTSLSATRIGQNLKVSIPLDDFKLVMTEVKKLITAGLSKFIEPWDESIPNDSVLIRMIRIVLAMHPRPSVGHKGLKLDRLDAYIAEGYPFRDALSCFPLHKDNPFAAVCRGLTDGESEDMLVAQAQAAADLLHDMPERPDEAVQFDVVKYFIRSVMRLYLQRKWKVAEDFRRTMVIPTGDKTFANMIFLGPLREPPASYYKAEDLASKIFKGIGHQSRLFNRETANEYIARISQRLQEIGVDADVTIEPLGEGEEDLNLFRLLLNDRLTGNKLSFAEVGFGISQVFPILAASEGSRDAWTGRLIVIEQPELHLHPKGQAKLSTALWHGLFYPNKESQGNGDDGHRSNTRFLIETHSEHFVRGFQVLVAKGLLKPEDFVVYYVDKNEKGESFVTKMEVDKYGFFTAPWPSGFFDQAFLQSVELTAERN